MTGLIYEIETAPGERRTPLQKEYDAKVLARVKRGIALLEKEHGPDWVEKLDLERLDLQVGSRCVVGQVYRDQFPGDPWIYSRGLTELGLKSEVYRYGFDLEEEIIDARARTEAYRQLTETWKYALTEGR